MTSVMADARHPTRRKASRLWWRVHQWVGLNLAIFMSFTCLTGTLAVVSDEMDWLMQPSLRVDPATVSAEPNWEAMARSAANYPRVKALQAISKPEARAFAARAMVVWDDNTYGFLHLHPATGAVQGEGPWVGAQRILRNLHRHLNLPIKYGVPIVGTLGVLLLVSFATSLVVYKKWWRGFLRPPRPRDGRTWWGDVHRLTGVWTLWFVLLIGATGSWYLVEELGAKAPVPGLKAAPPYAGPLPQVGERFAASLAAARIADPELRIQNVRFPTDRSGVFVFEGAKHAILVRPRANAVWTDVKHAQVLATYDGRDLNAHQRISEAADPLHFGNFGGYWTKIPWVLFGALLTSLSVSGVAVYGLRIGREMRQTAPSPAAVALIWSGMGVWRWVALAAVITGFVMMPSLFFERAG